MKEPARFAVEAMDLLRALVKQSKGPKTKDWEKDYERQRSLANMPRLLCRLARGPLPAALLDGTKDSEPEVRRLVVQALQLSGNPDVVKSVDQLRYDPDAGTQTAVVAALHALGRPDRP